MKLQSTKIGIIGLGYVGLPLAIEFSKNLVLLVLILMKNELKNLKMVKIIPMRLMSRI